MHLNLFGNRFLTAQIEINSKHLEYHGNKLQNTTVERTLVSRNLENPMIEF